MNKIMTDEENREMTRSNFKAQMEMLGYDNGGNPLDMVHVIRCKDCKLRPRYNPPESKNAINLKFPKYGIYNHNCPCECSDPYYSWMPDDDWFCANGERKEEGV